MNELNIKSFDSFLQKESKIEIHPNCIRHTDDFKMKEKMLQEEIEYLNNLANIVKNIEPYISKSFPKK